MELLPPFVVKRYVRKGIPSDLRGDAWFHYSGAEAKFKANPGLYYAQVQMAEQGKDTNEFCEIIERGMAIEHVFFHIHASTWL